MLAILSDLHFSDGTAHSENASKKAFELALREVYAEAGKRADLLDRDVELELVFLGDIFDLLRTERWFVDRAGGAVRLEDRPWASRAALEVGAPPAGVLVRAHAILEELAAANEGALAILSGRALPPPPGVKVRRIYLPGNHDRLVLHDPALLARARALVGADAPKPDRGEFLHHLELERYGLVARHGHEWDPWNFARHREDRLASELTDEDYLPTPIGDAVATELVARLPFELGRRLEDEPSLTAEERAAIVARMQRIEDVRPLLASFQWAYDQAGRVGDRLGGTKAAALRRALDETIRRVAVDFRELELFRVWEEKTQGSLLGLHMPSKLGALLALLGSVSAHTVGGLVERLGALPVSVDAPRDACRLGAARDRLGRVARRGLRAVVYGHTHEALEVPLHTDDEVDDFYLNTGTFRGTIVRAEDQRGFVGWERLTYVCFYAEDEATGPHAGRAFESWSGARRG